VTVSPELDSRFRDAAAAEGLLDVAYDLVDSPVGQLLVAVTDQGLCEIHYDPEPEREEEQLARAFGVRRSRPTRLGASSTSTSPVSARTSSSCSTFAWRASSAAQCSRSSPASLTVS